MTASSKAKKETRSALPSLSRNRGDGPARCTHGVCLAVRSTHESGGSIVCPHRPSPFLINLLLFSLVLYYSRPFAYLSVNGVNTLIDVSTVVRFHQSDASANRINTCYEQVFPPAHGRCKCIVIRHYIVIKRRRCVRITRKTTLWVRRMKDRDTPLPPCPRASKKREAPPNGGASPPVRSAWRPFSSGRTPRPPTPGPPSTACEDDDTKRPAQDHPRWRGSSSRP